jgi:Penicillin binding protein transpeptidase domain
LALGSAEVNLLEMTSAFAAIAADVESVEAYSVRSIHRGDQTLYTRAAPMRPSSADPAAREAMIDLLMTVVREGTGKAARIPGPAAGKTGTTQDYRDAWFHRIYAGARRGRLGGQRRQQANEWRHRREPARHDLARDHCANLTDSLTTSTRVGFSVGTRAFRPAKFSFGKMIVGLRVARYYAPLCRATR